MEQHNADHIGGVNEPGRLVDSWKDIAEYLGVSTRTAQLYAKSRELPVKKIGKRVVIYEHELKAWQLAKAVPLESPPPPTPPALWERPRVLKWWALTSTGIILAALITGVVYGLSSRAGQPVFVRWQGSVATASDTNGRLVWQRQFPYQLMEMSPGVREILAPWIGDLDRDGKNETVMPYYHIKREAEGWDIYCLSSKGETLWKMSPKRSVSNATRTFKPPYVLRGYAVFPSPERDGTFWTAGVFVHHTEYPTVLLIADSKGKQRGEFWHAGHLNSLRAVDLNGDGIVELIAGGVQHGAEQAVLVMLDPRDAHGAAQLEPADNPLQFRDMDKGSEKAVVYFPRSALNRQFERFNVMYEVEVVGDLIQGNVYEQNTTGAYFIYTLTRALTVKDLVISSAFWNVVRQDSDEQYAKTITSPEEIERLKKQVRVVWRKR